MKYLIWALLIGLAWAWYRAQRSANGRDAAAPPPQTPTPKAMVHCPVCGVHLPRDEAFVGRSGLYCSQAHREQHEG